MRRDAIGDYLCSVACKKKHKRKAEAPEEHFMDMHQEALVPVLKMGEELWLRCEIDSDAMKIHAMSIHEERKILQIIPSDCTISI